MTPRTEILIENIKEALVEIEADCWTKESRVKCKKVVDELDILEEHLHEVN